MENIVAKNNETYLLVACTGPIHFLNVERKLAERREKKKKRKTIARVIDIGIIYVESITQ